MVVVARTPIQLSNSRNEDPQRRAQIDAKLQTEQWEKVATFCSSCAQSISLRLAPWEFACAISCPAT